MFKSVKGENRKFEKIQGEQPNSRIKYAQKKSRNAFAKELEEDHKRKWQVQLNKLTAGKYVCVRSGVHKSQETKILCGGA